MSREVRLSRRDETLVDLLIETGLSRNIAKTLVFLSKRDETTSVEIEKATGLRQPEVSIAMQELRRRKWVDKRDIKKEGKGRPVHSYRLSVPWADILAQVDREEQAKIDRIEANRKKLKSFAYARACGRPSGTPPGRRGPSSGTVRGRRRRGCSRCDSRVSQAPGSPPNARRGCGSRCRFGRARRRSSAIRFWRRAPRAPRPRSSSRTDGPPPARASSCRADGRVWSRR